MVCLWIREVPKGAILHLAPKFFPPAPATFLSSPHHALTLPVHGND